VFDGYLLKDSTSVEFGHEDVSAACIGITAQSSTGVSRHIEVI
jgi:hypothetical protein